MPGGSGDRQSIICQLKARPTRSLDTLALGEALDTLRPKGQGYSRIQMMDDVELHTHGNQVAEAAFEGARVTVASLLSALALDGWLKVRDASPSAAEETGSSNPHIRLNAMGRRYMRWALTNRALFRAINHPDVKRYAGDELNDAVDNFSAIVRSAIDATRRAGRHAETSLTVLTIFTNAVPIGAATVLSDSLLAKFMPTDMDEEELIAQVVDLVVPLSGVEIEDGKSLSNSRPPSS